MHTHANPPQQKKKKIPTVAGLLLCDANRQERPGSIHLEWSLQPSMLAFTANHLSATVRSLIATNLPQLSDRNRT